MKILIICFVCLTALTFIKSESYADPVSDAIMIEQQREMIVNQQISILKMAEELAEITKMITTLNDQLENLKEQLDLQKQIHEGEEVLAGLKDIKTLYGSVLDLQEGFNNTVENIEDLQTEIESYFGPITVEDVEWGDKYVDIQVGRQTAAASLVSALELKQKTKDAEQSVWSLMNEDIKKLNPEGLNRFMAEALKNLLTLQFFQAKAQAEQAAAEAAAELTKTTEKIYALEREKYWEKTNLDFVRNLTDIGFYNKTDWK